MKLMTIAYEWLSEYKRTVEETTYRRTQTILDVHNAPYWLERKIEDITRKDILDYTYYRKEHGSPKHHPEGLARSTIKKHVNILRQICEHALKQELIAKSLFMIYRTEIYQIKLVQ